MRVNCDNIMHARWDLEASNARTRKVGANAQTRRVGALDKHLNWSERALFWSLVDIPKGYRFENFCFLKGFYLKGPYSEYFIPKDYYSTDFYPEGSLFQNSR